MKRFHFRLERVLALRQREIEHSEARLAAHDRKTQTARDEAARLRKQAASEAKTPAAGTRFPANRLAAASAYGESLQRKAEGREKSAEHMAAQKKTMLAAHLELRRKAATLDALREHAWKAHQREIERAEATEAMETHLAKRQRDKQRGKAVSREDSR